MKPSRICSHLLPAVLVLATATCGGGPNEPSVPVAAVNVSPGLATIAPGETTRLVATPHDARGNALSGRTVTWSTSNATIATVAGGLVTAAAPGAATITATSEGKSGTSVITVRAVVAAVIVTPVLDTIAPGETTHLIATLRDAQGNALTDRTVTWSTSNATIATVAGGLVTAAAPGAATITATSEGKIGASVITVAQSLISFASVSAGGMHTCGLDLNGVAYCWGRNSGGQLGNGSLAASLTPHRVVGGLRFSSLTAGYDHTCGLDTTGAAYCWGVAVWGQLGNGAILGGTIRCPEFSGFCSTVPVAVIGGHRFVAIANGSDHTCALTAAGQAYCWGWGENGELGADNYSKSCNPLAEVVCSAAPILADQGRPYTTIVGGFEHTCGLRPGGAAYCWGHEHHGQLGTGSDSLGGSSPRAVTGGLLFASLAAGGNSSCGVASDGALHCWGENGTGQLGDLTLVNRFSPVAVSGGLRFASVTVGSGSAIGGGTSANFAAHACGLTTSGVAYCWGNGAALGNGTTNDRTAPGAVAGGLVFGSITAGGQHTCGLTSNRVAYCWGSNGLGQLGSGSTNTSNAPLRVGRQP